MIDVKTHGPWVARVEDDEISYDGSTRMEAVAAVDLFCGAGGLTYGLQKAGVPVVAGIDLDEQSRHAFTANNEPARFVAKDIAETTAQELVELFGVAAVRVLAGCAPCQPFSKYTNGKGKHAKWDLLLSFERLVQEVHPEVVTMENVPELATKGKEVFESFNTTLKSLGYWVTWGVVNAADFGVPQNRLRLVLLASRLGPIGMPVRMKEAKRTVRETIAGLPPLRSGQQDPDDRIHIAADLKEINLRRIRATPHDGGTRAAWPEELLLECYRRPSGKKTVSVYGRMWWDRPAPTMTTLCNGIGNGRFGHPVQDRAISLREAALIQSFPLEYDFWPSTARLNRKAIARMIGNAVPPELGRALGETIVEHIRKHAGDGSGA